MEIKKTIYIILTMFLGLLLSFLAHAGIETWYIDNLLKQGVVPKANSLTPHCFLPLVLQIILSLLGLIGGYFLGKFWWRIIYVEKKRKPLIFKSRS